MERSLVRISSLFLLVILINHIVLATNARLISSMGSVKELEACPPTDKVGGASDEFTAEHVRAELVPVHPLPPSVEELKPSSEFSVEHVKVHPLPPSVKELEACPPTDDILTNVKAGPVRGSGN